MACASFERTVKICLFLCLRSKWLYCFALSDSILRGADRTAHSADGGQNGALGNGRVDVVGLLEQLHFGRAVLQGFGINARGDDEYASSAAVIELLLASVTVSDLRADRSGVSSSSMICCEMDVLASSTTSKRMRRIPHSRSESACQQEGENNRQDDKEQQLR